MSSSGKSYSNQNKREVGPGSRQEPEVTLRPASDQLVGVQYTLDTIGIGTAVLDQRGTILLVDQNWDRFAALDGLFLFGSQPGQNLLEICDSVEGRSAKPAREIATAIRSAAVNHRDRFEYTFDSPTTKRCLAIELNHLRGTEPDKIVVHVAEVALRESEDRYRDLVEYSEDLLCTHDLSGRLLSVNRASARILGYEVDELVQKQMQDFLAPEFRGQFDEYLSTVQRYGHAKGTMVVLTRTGERRVWKYHNTLDTEGVGSPAIRGMAQDITERKKLEKALRFSEEKFSKAFRSSPTAMAITTAGEGRFVDVNESFEEQSGYQSSEVIGHTSLELGMWVDLSERAAIAGHLANCGSVRNFEVKLRTKLGQVRTVMYSAEMIEVDGELCVLAAGEDITARKKAEDALRCSEADYRSLFEGAPYGILRATLDGKMFRANPALVRMLGYESESELLAANLVTQVCVDAAEGILALNRYWHAERFEDVELHWRRKDGSPIFVRAYGRPIRHKDSEAASLEIMVEDLTRRRALEEQLRQSQKMEAIALLASGIAHDFNTLLTGILGYGERLLMAANLADEPRRQAEGVMQAALQARSLTRQLLALGRKQVLRPKVLDLNALIKDAEDLLRRLLGDNIRFAIDLAPNVGRVKADPGQLTQVIMNLVVNARDAMPEGGELTIKTLPVDLTQPDHQLPGIDPGEYATLAVIDTGCGMDETTQARIFEPFFTTKPHGRGTGLGLSTVYGIIEQTGGRIRVSSRPGQGTAFELYFPPTDEPAERTKTRDLQSSPADGCATVLVVEDDDLARRLTCELLEGHGYTVLKAKNGPDALKIARKQTGTVDLLLTDVVMPGMSGQELAKHLAKLHPETKVLYMTGYAETLVGAPVSEPTDTVPLEKPFLRHELMSKVHQVLGQEGNRLVQPS